MGWGGDCVLEVWEGQGTDQVPKSEATPALKLHYARNWKGGTSLIYPPPNHSKAPPGQFLQSGP